MQRDLKSRLARYTRDAATARQFGRPDRRYIGALEALADLASAHGGHEWPETVAADAERDRTEAALRDTATENVTA